MKIQTKNIVELEETFATILQTSCDLAASVIEDAKEQRHVTDETIRLAKKLKIEHTELEGVLDAINGVN